MSSKFIVIDGVIGAGKTTLIHLLISHYKSKGLHAHPIFEPVDIWEQTGALKYFYENIPERSYQFQTFTYITRIQRILDELAKSPNADIYILERSIWSDRYIFVELLKEHLQEPLMTMYNTWWDMWVKLHPQEPDLWVLCNTSLETSIERIGIRNRDAETQRVNVEYQTKLYQQHQIFYQDLKTKNKKILIIDNQKMDQNFIENKAILASIADTINYALLSA